MRGKWRNLKAVATQLLCYMIVLLSTKNEQKYCFNRQSLFGVRAIWTRTSCLWLQIQSESGAANLKVMPIVETIFTKLVDKKCSQWTCLNHCPNLLTTYSRFIVIVLGTSMRTHFDVGLITAYKQSCNAVRNCIRVLRNLNIQNLEKIFTGIFWSTL